MLPKEDLKSNLKMSIICCQNHVQTITTVDIEKNSILEWFKFLCENLTETITLIGKCHNDIKEKINENIQRTLLLYLTQTLSTLSLLISIFVREDEIGQILTEARKCVMKQLDCCLESIQLAVCSDTVPDDPSGNFVKWMDLALAKITEIDVNNQEKMIELFEEARRIFEEVLSHAMSIAQISLEEDNKIVRGSCQSVLNNLNLLAKEVTSCRVNGAMVNLFIDGCSDKLCNLEKKVNTAVLRLCMKTFSKFTEPLDRIHRFCFNFSNKENMEEFDGLVADFDLHVDRIMQIGLFAVSCSSDFARGIKIRSCLASLEALESELVPSLHSVLLDNSTHNINCATLLKQYWLNQANTLQKLIYLIIDPFAFCQVIYEESCEIVDRLSSLLKKNTVLKQEDVNCLIEIAKVLKDFLCKAQNEFTENEMNRVNIKLKAFSDVVEEVETASKLLLSSDIVNVESSLRVLKRCKILLTVVKRLWYCFFDDVPQKNNLTYCQDSKEKQDEELSNKLSIEGNVFLGHIINRGRQILQERSILYKTPVKDQPRQETPLSKCKNNRKEIPLSKLVHLRKFSFVNVTTKTETSLDLQITDILNEMTNLSTTFNKKDI